MWLFQAELLAQLEDEPDEGLGNFSATQQEKKIADKLAENTNDIKVSKSNSHVDRNIADIVYLLYRNSCIM